MDAGGFFSDAPDAGSVRKQMASVTGGFLGKKSHISMRQNEMMISIRTYC